MNRHVLLTIGFLVALGAAAYGQTFTGSPDFQNPRVLAGEIEANGTILRGTGFTARRVSLGHYQVRFEKGIFLNACPIMTVTGVSTYSLAPIGEVYQGSCGRLYDVIFHEPGTRGYADQTFDFIAVGT